MAQRGRPPSIDTIGNRINHLVNSVTTLTDSDARTMSDIAALLKSGKGSLSPKALGTMVESLDRIHRETQLTDGQDKLFVAAIDGLARFQVQADSVKPKPKPKPAGKPDWMVDNERVLAEAAAANTPVDAIVGAIVVILAEVKSGEANNDDFDTLAHLVRTLQRIY